MKTVILASMAVHVAGAMESFLPKSFSELVIAVIPTASTPYGDDKPWLDEEIKVFKALGCKLHDVDIEGKNETQLREQLKSVDAVLVTGGNTYYLLHHALLSGFDKVIRELIEQGVVYIGSSAGSVLAGPTVDIARRLDDPNIVPLNEYNALGLIDFCVLPHVGHPKYAETVNEVIREWQDKPYKVLGLTDRQALVITGRYHQLIEA